MVDLEIHPVRLAEAPALGAAGGPAGHVSDRPARQSAAATLGSPRTLIVF